MSPQTVTRKAVSLSSLNGNALLCGLDLLKMQYPIMPSYCNGNGIETIEKLEEIFGGDKKKVMKYISVFEQVEDKQDFERYLESKNYEELIKLLGFEHTIEMLTIIRDKKISLHNFISNLAKIRQGDSGEDLWQFLKVALQFSVVNLMEVLGYMNYKKVRYAKNVEQMKKHIQIIIAARNGVTASNEATVYMDLVNIESDDKVRFTKSSAVIATIGGETLCCFRKGGAAASLLEPAQKSPIAGIIDGRLSGKRWFSFVWEMVEVEDGEIKKCLILDNIEANGHVSDGSILWSRLRALKGYRTIYCGYLRNDITFEDGVTENKKEKQAQLAGYEKSFERYGSYDDSRYLYTIANNEPSMRAWIKRMNNGDLMRAKYMEKYIYGRNADEEFVKIDVNASPSYIIESDTNIFGYFVTRLKYYDKSKSHKYAQHADVSGKALTEWKKERSKWNKENPDEPKKDLYEGLDKVLYLEDILCLQDRKVKASLRHAFDHLTEWCRKNGITKLVANTNRNSKAFIDRIKEAGFEFVEQDTMPAMLPDQGFYNSASYNKKVESVENRIEDEPEDAEEEDGENEEQKEAVAAQ